MFQRSYIKIIDINKSYQQYIDQIITVCGWVRSHRSAQGGTICFIDINDGSTSESLNIVFTKNNHFATSCSD